MIILDTCAIIYDALNPKQLSKAAKHCIEQYEKENALYKENPTHRDFLRYFFDLI